MGIYYVTIINGLEKVISRKGGHYNSFYNWNRQNPIQSKSLVRQRGINKKGTADYEAGKT